MAFLVGGANSAADTGYDIDNSLRFNDDDSPDLGITLGTPSTANVFTFSFWFKLGDWETSKVPFSAGTDSNNFDQIILQNNGTIIYHQKSGGSNTSYIQPSALYRDPSAWYHLVVGVDTTQSTDTNRIKMYVNGSQISSFATETYCDQNEAAEFNTAVSHTVGTQAKGDTHADYMDGYLADFYFIDGTQYAASDFGETDEDSGIWKPKEASVTFGDNGFFLEFKQTGTSQDSSGIGADTSGEDNHFAVTNLAATDQTTDTPTNNFCTLNPLDPIQGAAYSEGNCYAVTNSSNRNYVTGTMAVNKGKWYWESKLIAVTSDATDQVFTGVADLDDRGVNSTGQSLGDRANEVGWHQEEGKYQRNNSWSDGSSAGDSADWTIDDIISIALDMDNNRVTIAKNGQWADGSGNADEASPTSYVSVTNSYMTAAFGEGGGGTEATFSVNFGNPPHAISSGNADANGYGNFEFAPPSGFYALCTKNLAEYG